jgi:hypothetical protein
MRKANQIDRVLQGQVQRRYNYGYIFLQIEKPCQNAKPALTEDRIPSFFNLGPLNSKFFELLRSLLRIIGIDEKQKSLYMINQSGRMTWPLQYEKLEEVHNKIHNGEITLLSYEIDKLIPTWGTYISGLFKYLGCDKG